MQFEQTTRRDDREFGKISLSGGMQFGYRLLLETSWRRTIIGTFQFAYIFGMQYGCTVDILFDMYLSRQNKKQIFLSK